MKRLNKKAEDQIQMARDIILKAGILKQEAEKLLRENEENIRSAIYKSFWTGCEDSAKGCIRFAVDEIRRLRGWLPD